MSAVRIFRVVVVLTLAVVPAAALAQSGQAEVTPAFEPVDFAVAVDPRADGWDTEALSEQAEAQLKRIAAWLAEVAAGGVDAVPSGDVATVVDQAFESPGFVPEELTARYQGPAFTVERGSVVARISATAAPRASGAPSAPSPGGWPATGRRGRTSSCTRSMPGRRGSRRWPTSRRRRVQAAASDR